MNRGVVLAIAGLMAMGLLGYVFMSSRGAEPRPAPASTPVAPPVSGPPIAKPEPKPVTRSAKPAESVVPTPEAAPATATLVFESDVPETTVFIDRVFIGTLPTKAPNVAPGSHQITFSAPGFDGIRMSVDVEPGTRTITARFKEIVLDERAGVTHKHAMGSCAGTLLATPQGLRYDTTNAGDAFSVPLQNLETFDMDYVAKNLKVKIRGGKTYNFAGADGNADGLYAFHQAVDKVRKRLISKNRP